MSETESSDATVLHTAEIELNLDYMLSLHMYIEDDLSSSDDFDNTNELTINDTMTIRKIINFLRANNKTNEEIKDAISLLYDSIHPNKKESALVLLNQIFTQRTETNISGIFSMINSLEQNNTDHYTGDMINPSLFLNVLSNTQIVPEDHLNIINNNPIVDNNPFVNIFNTMLNIPMTDHFEDFNVPITFEWIHPVGQSYVDVKNVATDTILSNNTKVLLFNELDDINKNRYKTCSICIEDYEQDDTIRQLSCSHIFHKNCIDPWLLKESYKCPLCRNDTLPHEQN
jgi:hypothetical protein